VTQKEWKKHYRSVEYVEQKGAALNTRASFVVENGRPRLNEV
jgi:hypothetical protein